MINIFINNIFYWIYQDLNQQKEYSQDKNVHLLN